MRLVINLMIFAGSALMIYNIVRYGSFVKESLTLENRTRKGGILIVPLLLLVFFLVVIICRTADCGQKYHSAQHCFHQ